MKRLNWVIGSERVKPDNTGDMSRTLLRLKLCFLLYYQQYAYLHCTCYLQSQHYIDSYNDKTPYTSLNIIDIK